MPYDHEKVNAIITVKKMLMEPGTKAPTRYLQAWLTLHELQEKIIAGGVHPVMAEAIAPFAPKTANSGDIENGES